MKRRFHRHLPWVIVGRALTALALLAAYVEEVRIGFERWVRQPEVVASAGADLSQANAYRINETLLAVNHGGQNRGYLLFPEARTLASNSAAL